MKYPPKNKQDDNFWCCYIWELDIVGKSHSFESATLSSHSFIFFKARLDQVAAL